MENTHINSSSKFVASQSDFQKLILILKKKNYTIIAPKVKDNAIIYDEIVSAEDLPIGIKDKQEKGKYFIEKTSSGKYFDFVVGPNSLKNYFFPTEKIIFKAVKK